jgi:hypothetical protein
MNRFLGVTLGLTLCACSGSSTKPPASQTANSPTSQAPNGSPDGGTIDHEPTIPVSDPPDGFLPTCCMVNFAFPDENGNEPSVVLRGNAPPLSSADGVALTYSSGAGAWQGTVCIPIDYSGYYWYDITRTDDRGNAYSDIEANTFAPITTSNDYGIVNTFMPVADCNDSSLADYSKTM